MTEQDTAQDTEQAEPQPLPPVKVSGEAHKALSDRLRQWSGWSDSRLVLGAPDPSVSRYASTDPNTHTFTVNADALLLNPNRVLNTITPFRLRQEAVLTGAMLHEAGHARRTKWAKTEMNHGPTTHDGAPVNKQTRALALLLEEPRIEGLMALAASQAGAGGLEWTMKASAAFVTPLSNISDDPDQMVMDVISSWVLRAAKAMAFAHWTGTPLPSWVAEFNSLLHEVLVMHFDSQEDRGPGASANLATQVKDMMFMMAVSVDDDGTYMVDTARDVLDLLFPETDGDAEGAPMPADPHGAGGGGEAPSEAAEDGEGQGQAPAEGAGKESEGTGEDDPHAKALADLIKALGDLEKQADQASEAETETEQRKPSGGAGTGGENAERGWRQPDKAEREIQRGAERFLRDLIAPTEASQVTLSEQPSATVDGAALAEWKAGGQSRDPRFFIRTRRSVQPAPPVEIAVLVDVSGSMDDLQKPSAVLSWALSAAAIDLRNFAGRGVQVRSCLIHWGFTARVIQSVGQVLPGIKEFECREGTDAMGPALEMVEEQIPGFFDPAPHPVNRLLVHFTDWDLGRVGRAGEYTSRALAAGVNIVSVVPEDYSVRRSHLPDFIAASRVQRGKSVLLKYNKMFPGQVWDTAAQTMGENR